VARRWFAAPVNRALPFAAGIAATLALAPVAHAATPVFTLQSESTWGAATPLIGGSVYTPPVVEGGWSAFAAIDDNTYWTVSDRGPNGQPTVGGATRRTFLTPAFTPTIYKVQIGAGGALNVLQRIPLHLKAGATDPARAAVGGPANEITGLPQISTVAQGTAAGLPADTGVYKQSAARDEVPYGADGTTILGTDPYGIDSESIAVDPRDGSFWLGDEYRPSLVHVAADGTVLNRLIPAGVTVPDADDAIVKTQPLLPRSFVFRKQNRGMEGGTLSKDGKTLFGMLQSSIEPPAGKGDSRTLRLVRFDVSDSLNPVLTGEFVYRLSVPHAGSGIAQTDLSNSDIYALDDTHLLVDEHDNVTSDPGAGEKRVYAIDLAGATNLVGDAANNGENPTLESTNAAGVTPVAKTLWLSLEDFAYDHDKPEGIGLFPNGDLAVQDDNDFGFNQGNDPGTLGPNDPPFKVSASGKTTQLWRFKATNIASGGVSGTVPATLSLTLGQAATFGTFTPGLDHTYTAGTTASVISTAGDAALSVSDPGKLTNGAFSLAEPLQVTLSKAAWTGPVSNDPVTIAFSQHIGGNEALRTGTYSKTLTFTLSTTTP
jgi:phytase-like protein